MNRAIEYWNALQKRKPSLFNNGFVSALLTEKDIEKIEQKLNYSLPEPYKDFLTSCQMPQRCKVNIRLCGDLAVSFADEEDENDLYTVVELELYHPAGNTAEDFLENASSEDVYISDDFSVLDVGFLKIAKMYGYLIFLDLVTGKVVSIYHEELWEMTVVEGVDGSDKEAIRDYMLDSEFCHDFYDFLRMACTDDIYDEDNMTFQEME